MYFDKLYDKFTDMEKKEFLNSFVEQVDIYEQEQADGRFLKHIKFRFPVYFNNGETTDICWDNESTVETVTTCHGINFPLFFTAVFAAASSPPQQGTSILIIVTL